MGFRISPLLAALAAVVLWSTNAYAADHALAQMSLGWLLLIQFSTAAAALLSVRALRTGRHTGARTGRRTDTPNSIGSTRSAEPARPDRTAILIGVVGLTGTMFLQYLAFATAPIVAANVLAYAWPLMAAGWLAATIRDRQTLVSAGLALLGFLGIALVFTGPGQGVEDPSTDGAAPWGYLAALGSAACMALYTLGVSRRATVGMSPPLIPATIAGVAAALVVLVIDGGASPTGTGLLLATYLGLGPMAAGYALWTRAMAGGGAERLSPLGYATPLLSTAVLLVTGSPAAGTTFVGVGLILGCSLGVLAYDRYAERGSRGSPPPS